MLVPSVQCFKSCFKTFHTFKFMVIFYFLSWHWCKYNSIFCIPSIVCAKILVASGHVIQLMLHIIYTDPIDMVEGKM